jgi:hypothetical protein
VSGQERRHERSQPARQTATRQRNVCGRTKAKTPEVIVISRHGFVQVDSYPTPGQNAAFEACVLTAKFHDDPDGWTKLFEEASYTDDYYWTIIE